MIREAVVTSVSAAGIAHVAPMGIHERDGCLGIGPFRPSTTLSNVLETRCAAINFVDDVRIIAGCLTGRRDWPLVATEKIQGVRLQTALSHVELELEQVDEQDQRTWLWLRPVHEGLHRPFRGFNRGQMSVLEAAILISRLHMLPAEKVDRELAYLRIGLEKTAGPNEQEAWQWLMQALERFRAQNRTEGAS